MELLHQVLSIRNTTYIMKDNEFDIIVIGAGSAGLGSALGMLKIGMKVLMVDKSAENIGGECLNTGCVPSKALIQIAKKIHHSKSVKRFGLESSGTVSIKEVMAEIHEKKEIIREHENVDFLREKGLQIILGTAKFLSKNSLEINGHEYYGKNIVIGTGSSPRIIDVKGLEHVKVYTNDNLFEMNDLPEHFLFVGGGPVSMEMGQAFSRLGSKVTILELGNRILKKENEKISEVLQERLESEGMVFHLNSELIEINSRKNAILKIKGGKEIEIPVDAIFMGLGRVLSFENLNLEKAGVKLNENGTISLDSKLRTSNKHIFVSGDAANNLMFSHAAEMHSKLLLNNFLSPFKKRLNVEHFSWVTFTEPEVGTFGHSELKLKKNKVPYERLEQDFSEDDRAIIDGYQYGKLVLFIEKKSIFVGNAKLLGGSLIAPNAGEIIQELILANTAGLSISTVMNKIYAYPTAANVNKVIFRRHMVSMLKPWLKNMMKWYYRL